LNKSDSVGKLAAALSKAQGAIKGADKNAKNPHFKSSYANLESVWIACRQALVDNELAVSQLPTGEGQTIGMETVLMHSSGEWMSSTFFVTARDASPQAVGSALTYLRRYGLAAIVGVAPSDEDDDAEAAQPTRAQARPVAVGKPQPVASDDGSWKCGAALQRTILDLEVQCQDVGIYKTVRDRLETTFHTRNPASLNEEEAARYKVYLSNMLQKAQEAAS
jgi:hypothetical protein